MEEESLSAQIAAFIAGRAAPKLEALAKKADKAATNPELKADLAEEELALKSKFAPAEWLTDAARRAGQIQFTTHPIKFTNSQAKGATSCYAGPGPQQPEGMPEGALISTASLQKPAVDVDGNAAALDVAALLQLEQDGRTLLDHVRAGDAEPLRPFADSDAQLADWMKGFAQAVSAAKPSSHTLAKQLYFPVGAGEYHLLSPLFSSSLAQAIYERMQKARFSDAAKEARKARREEAFHESLTVDYPNTAVMSFGGTKPQNVSQLNSRRGGKVHLLSCAPPTWKRMTAPPLKTSTVFSWHHFGARVYQETYLLNKFLERVADKDSAMQIRDQRAELIDRIIDQLLQYAAEIQHSFAAGWSSRPECRLDRAEQLWLDPRRGSAALTQQDSADAAFKAERERNDWQKEIADRFARWLNRRIDKGKGRQVLFTGDAEHLEWKSLLEKKLRLLKDDLEALA
jgi:CRISPR-associated protein Csy1